MHGMLHVLATLIVVPYALLAGAFLLLGQAIGSGGSLLALFETLLRQATWLVPWGAIGIALGFLVLAALGLHGRWRWMAAAALCGLACGAVLVIALLGAAPLTVDAALFLAPCIAVAIFSGTLSFSERGGSSRVRAGRPP